MKRDALASHATSLAKDRGSGRTGGSGRGGAGRGGQWRLKASPLPTTVMESQAAFTVPLTLQGKLALPRPSCLRLLYMRCAPACCPPCAALCPACALPALRVCVPAALPVPCLCPACLPPALLLMGI